MPERDRPVASRVAIGDVDAEDWVLTNAPAFVDDRRLANRELAAGVTVSLDAFLGEKG